jgi:hypothetical protein
MPPIIAMTASGEGRRARGILSRLHEREIVPDAVLLLTGDLGPPPGRRGEPGLQRFGRWPRSAAGSLRHRLRIRRGTEVHRWFEQRCRRVMVGGDVNGRRTRRALERIAPDYLVLGTGALIRPSVIGAARLGVLNAHPALLPWVRGCGVMGHSLASGVALGATVHLVDAGIDTGAIVARRLLEVPPGPASLRELEVASAELAADLMAEVVEAIVRRGEPVVGMAQPERFGLFRAEDPQERSDHQALARAGRAGELFERWRPLCTEPGLTLPADAQLSPR